jgi:hypothetical protein
VQIDQRGKRMPSSRVVVAAARSSVAKHELTTNAGAAVAATAPVEPRATKLVVIVLTRGCAFFVEPTTHSSFIVRIT